MGSDKSLIGKRYARQRWSSAAVDLQAFAEASGVAHPMYQVPPSVMQPMAVVLATATLGVSQIIGDRALIGDPARLLKLLHRAEDICWTRPLRCGEHFVVDTKLDAIDTTAAGESLYVVTDLYETKPGAHTAWVVRARTTLFIRERTRMPPRIKDSGSIAAAAPTAQVVQTHEAKWRVAMDQAERYARASGDNNPIHLDDAVAQKAGLSGRVVHGLCTMSFAAQIITEAFGDGNWGRLRNLTVRFARPVYLGEQLTLTAEAFAGGRIAFVVRNEAGRIVLDEGAATVTSAASC